MGRIMKRKILALGLFSLCILAMFTGELQAFFGLLSPYHPSSLWHRHNRYVTQITCRPYNAFTPICWGNLVCDGCNPSPCGVAGGCMPINMGVPPWAQSGCCGIPGGFAPNYAYASDMMSAPQQGPMMPMPDVRSQPFMPPAPMPVPTGPNTTMMYPQSGVAQANYYPMYMPQYYPPTFYNPYQNMQPMPYYWYNGGR
jgi:hypothetical protein